MKRNIVLSMVLSDSDLTNEEVIGKICETFTVQPWLQVSLLSIDIQDRHEMPTEFPPSPFDAMMTRLAPILEDALKNMANKPWQKPGESE